MESEVNQAHSRGEIGGISQGKKRPEAGARSSRAIQTLPAPCTCPPPPLAPSLPPTPRCDSRPCLSRAISAATFP